MSEKIVVQPNEEVAEILPGYLERRRAEFKQVQESLAKEDYTALMTFGHNVKGTAGSYGLPELGQLAEAVFYTAGQKNLSGCAESVKAYGEYLDRIEIAGA